LVAVLVAICLVAPVLSPAAFAQCGGVCKSNEILVGEDETSCYCKDRAAYAACVADKARTWQNKNKAECGRQAERCFRGQGYELTGAGLMGVACLLNCAAADALLPFARSCVTTCASSASIATKVVEKCAVDLNNQCRADALKELRDSQLTCRD
jgi:hypothetical protein